MKPKFWSLAYVAGIALILALGFSLVMTPGAQKLAAQEPTPKLEGVAYTSWWHGEYSDPNSDTTLAIIEDVGAEWISVLTTWYQDTLTSTTIQSDTDRTPTDADVIHAIETAHALGMNVMLKPHLDVYTDEWRGKIGEGKFTTEAEWDAWFASYQDFINYYAQIAADYDVEMFCVGTELDKTAVEEMRWREVITGTGGITSIYTGSLVYAANHTYTNTVMFWDALDYIGIDAYYQVGVTNTDTLEDFEMGWTAPISFLAELADEWDKDILFTEIGYRSADGAGVAAWDYEVTPPIDMQEQADLYQAFFNVVYPESWFAGVFWWNWTTNPMQGGPCSSGYEVLDKPAELILREYFEGNPKAGANELIPRSNEDASVYIYMDDALESDADGGWWGGTWHGGTIAYTATDEVYTGTSAIRADLVGEGWDAANFGRWGTAVSTTPYYWLEFYMKQQDPSHGIQLVFEGGNAFDYCRYTIAEENGWRQVRVPFEDAGKVNQDLTAVAFQTVGNDTTFWLDNIRLLGVFPVELSDGYTQTAKQGAVVTYTHTLKNFSSVIDTMSVEAIPELEWPLHLVVGGEVGTTYMGPIQIGPGMTTTVQVVTTVPMTETVGITNDITVTATSLSMPQYSDALMDVVVVESSGSKIYLPLVLRRGTS